MSGDWNAAVYDRVADPSPEDALAYLETVNLRSHLDRLPQDLRRPYAEEVLDRLGQPLVIHYVRLNLEATA